ncbi:MAG TPA: transketolase [Thermoplasmata archaeon]|nr:transketolase [Thermoplasmata archaeon]
MADDVPPEVVDALTATALEIRREVVRMTYRAQSGHPGGSLSAVELLTALVFRELRIDPARPTLPDRDRFVLSKGHAAPALYAALALRGFFPRTELPTFRQFGSRLQGNPDRRRLPGVDASTGGLGQGIGMAVGMALDAAIAHGPARTYALVGDGECQAGATWEAFLVGAHQRLGGLTVMIDRNRFQGDGATEEILEIEPLVDKLKAFGWRTAEIDGHDFPEILRALAAARTSADRPTAIVAHTVKGKGVSFMENSAGWHGRAPTRDEAERALGELGSSLEGPVP